MIHNGTDKFGTFRLVTDHGGFCNLCKDDTPVVVVYYGTLNLEGVKLKDTIMGGGNEAVSSKFIGVACGCYAKFHRQVTHIQERVKARAAS